MYMAGSDKHKFLLQILSYQYILKSFIQNIC